MLCENCGKNKATVHVTKIINGTKTEIFLCEKCAKEKGELEISFEGKFPLHQFFSSLMGFPGEGSEKIIPAGYSGLQCPGCGLTYTQFGQIGHFGCDRCYESFGENLLPLLRRLHGSQKHIGKIPARAGSHVRLKKEIEVLREELQRKVAEEAFEEAAEIRDKIRRLESEFTSGGENNG
jgi:protein arginine kinase activator